MLFLLIYDFKILISRKCLKILEDMWLYVFLWSFSVLGSSLTSAVFVLLKEKTAREGKRLSGS